MDPPPPKLVGSSRPPRPPQKTLLHHPNSLGSSHKNHRLEYKNLNYCHGFKKYSLVKIFHYVFNRRRIMILLETTHYNACRVFLDQTLYHGISHENDYYYVNYILILMLYVLIQSRNREKDFYHRDHRGLGFRQYHFLL
ncbi:hypothetical protein RYX36_016498 [Vicia faba]